MNSPDIRPAREVVAAFLDALTQRNPHLFPALLAPEIIQTIAFSPTGEPESFTGRQIVSANLAEILAMFERIDFDHTELYATDDHRTVFVEAHANITVSGALTSFRNQYLFKFCVIGGLITQYVEYFNPVTLHSALAQTPPEHADNGPGPPS